MATVYELRTETTEYQYPSLDALYSDLQARFESNAHVSVYALSGGSYDAAPTPDSQYHAGKGAWQTPVWQGDVKDAPATQFERDYMDIATANLGNRQNG